MAGAGFKTFNTGDVLLASEVNTYLMQQTVMVFDDAAARTTALTGVVAEGMLSYLKDTNAVERYDGSAWGAIGAGDIEGVTAGTGISGGGSSGTVTITNSMATAIDAKGDLIVGTGADTFDRLAVGTNGYTLVADSAETTGLKWAAASSPSFVGCSLYQTSDQSVNTGVYTALNFAGESFDTDNFHDTSTNNTRITIPSGKGGKYLCIVAVQFGGTGTNDTAVKIELNGSGTARIMYLKSPNGDLYVSFSAILSLVATDYIEVFVNPGTNTSTYSSATRTNFAVQYLGA